jgi:hypothetical protein
VLFTPFAIGPIRLKNRRVAPGKRERFRVERSVPGGVSAAGLQGLDAQRLVLID